MDEQRFNPQSNRIERPQQALTRAGFIVQPRQVGGRRLPLGIVARTGGGL